MIFPLEESHYIGAGLALGRTRPEDRPGPSASRVSMASFFGPLRSMISELPKSLHPVSGV